MSTTELLIKNELKHLDRKYMKGLERLYKLNVNSGNGDNFKGKTELEKRLQFIYKIIR